MKLCYCIVCRSDVEISILLKSNGHHGDIVRCQKCQTTFVNPMPSNEEITDYYKGMYQDLAGSFSKQKMDWAIDSIDGYIRELKKLHRWPRRDFLDIGGGLGYYSKAASIKGLTAVLVEIDPISTDFAKRHLGLPSIYRMSIEEFAQKSSSYKYDLIFLRHVVEHYKDPASLFSIASSLLEEGGVLILETDNNQGIEILLRPATAKFYTDLYRNHYLDVSWINLLKVRPFAVDPPRHLFGFRSNNLSLLLKYHNLEPVKSINYMLGDPVYWPNIPHTKLSTVSSNFLNLRGRAFLTSLLDLLGYPVRYLLKLRGLASGICIYAIKQQS